MATDLTIKVPDELRAAMEITAQAEGRTIEEVATEAMKRYVAAQENVREINELATWGERHARERGFKPSDVQRAISDIRRGR
jgi:predicted transcriptional regulator